MPSETTVAPTSRAKATIADASDWRTGSSSIPQTSVRSSLRMSGFTRVTWRKEAKPEPTSSTATRTPSAQAIEVAGEGHVVLDRLVLGDLDHQWAVGPVAGDHEGQLFLLQHGGGEVQCQVAAGREPVRVGFQRELDHGELELDAHVDRVGVEEAALGRDRVAVGVGE